ncbi:MAG TPA: RHS repeat protein, partial [Rhodocyclaceae bacterium]|nr:RHS repeat protein [Rhodocyclaceae bacterium]
MTTTHLHRFLLLVLLALSGLARGEVSYPNGDWREESIEEYRVKVVGGWVRVQRDYVFDQWQINARWNPLGFEKDLLDDSVKRITRNEAVFEKQGDAYVFGKRALIRAQPVLRLPPGSPQGSAPGDLTTSAGSTAGGGIVLDTVAGYRWSNRDGQWIDYDGEGKIVAYGDRNDIRVWLDYGLPGSPDAGRIVGVRDHFGRTVLTYAYDAGGRISQVTEADPASGSSVPTPSFTPRRLQLTWSGALLTQATDVLGHTTTHSYTGGTPARLKTVTDPEGRVRAIDYGPTGRVSKVTAPDGGITTYQYDYDKLKRVFYLRQDGPSVLAGTPVLELWFDADGREIRRDLNGATQSKLLQDSANRSQTYTDARGLVTVVTLDEFDNP